MFVYNILGKQTFEDGTVYEGNFESDLRHGIGTLTWPNGEVCYCKTSDTSII